MSQWYDLQGHTPVPVPFGHQSMIDLFDESKRQKERRVGSDTFTNMAGEEINVSTVFLALDHAFSQEAGPILFETMIFGGEQDQWQRRYRTWADAEFGHTLALLWVMGYGDEPE